MNTQRYLFLALIALSFAFVVISCKKDEAEMIEPQQEVVAEEDTAATNDPNPAGAAIHSDNLGHVFQEGSYWIYRDDSTFVEDSFYVHEVVFYSSFQFYAAGGGGQISPHLQVSLAKVRNTSGQDTYSYVTYENTMDFIWGSTLPDMLPFATDLYGVMVWDGTQSTDTMTLSGEFFDEVQVCNFGPLSAQWFSKKNVGVIQHPGLQGTATRTLVRWNIVL